MLENQFSTPRHQAFLGVIIIFAKNVRRFINGVIAIVAYSYFGGNSSSLYIGVAIGLGVIGMGIWSWIQYKRFWFHVDEQGLQIKDGVINKEKITIPFDRIQTVHLHQNVVQRLLNMTGVKVDTAGSAKKELEIQALTKQDALSLQDLLQKYKEQLAAGWANQTDPAYSTQFDSPRVADTESASVKEEKDTLVKLTFYQLLQVGLTQNHIRNGFVAIGFFFGLYWQFDNLFDDFIGKSAREYADEILTSWVMVLIFGLILFLIGSVMLSIGRTFLRYFDLHAYLTKEALHVNAGLLKRNEYTVPINKIQFVEWYSNFLREIPSFESMKIFQGQSEDSKKQSVVVPACFDEQTFKLMKTLFPESTEFPGFETHKVDSFYERFLIFIWGALATVSSIVIALAVNMTSGLIAIVVLLAVIFLCSKKFVNSITLQFNGQMLLYQRGWLFTKRTALKNYKIQSVSWTQSFFQKRRNTAHLTLYTAAGSRTVRFINADLAKALHNFLLYEVEVSKKSWM